MLALSLLGATLVASAYAHVHGEIVAVEQAQGYVDPTLETGIALGFIVMLVAAGALAVAAAWSAVKLLRAIKAKKS